jgi:hypothetical protein
VDAFAYDAGLSNVWFNGNDPQTAPFNFPPGVTVYYFQGTTGWTSSFSAHPPVLWNPVIETGDARFGVQNTLFGFNITSTNTIPIVVEACADLAAPVWIPVQSLTLSNNSFYFSDPAWMDYPTRFYRLSPP